MRNLIGQSGELRLEKYTLSTQHQDQEYLLVVACLENGQALETETAQRLLLVPGQAETTEKKPETHRYSGATTGISA